MNYDMVRYFIAKKEKIAKNRHIVIILSILTLLFTLYALSLPAISLDTDNYKAPEQYEEMAEESGTVSDTPEEETGEEVLNGTYKKESEDYSLHVKVSEEAGIPSDSELYFEEVADHETYLKEAKKHFKGEKIENAIFFNIGFSSEGRESEPQSAVDVSLKMKEKINGTLVHFTEDSMEIVDGTIENKKLSAKNAYQTDVSFTAESFSVYGIIESTLAKTILASDGKNYKITLTSVGDPEIDDDAELAVEEITKDSPDFEEYKKQSEEALGIENASYVRFFDISILKDGKKIQPADRVDVRIQLADKEEDKESYVVHFGEEVEVIDSTTTGKTIDFSADSFSIYSIVEVPEPDPSESPIPAEVTELDGEAFYLSVTKNNSSKTFYFMDSIIENNKIKKTAANAIDTAAEWYFELVQDNQFYLYTYDANDEKVYMCMNNSGNMSLSSTPSNTFYVELYNNQQGKFYIYHKVGNNKYGLNMFSGENGKGFAGWTGKDDGSVIVPVRPVVTPADDSLRLDGETFGLLNYKSGPSGAAMMAQPLSATHLKAQTVTTRTNPLSQGETLYVAQDSDISMYTFHSLGGNQYQITVETENGTKYLSVSNTAVTLVDSPDANCTLTITRGAGAYQGRIRIANADNYSPNLYSGSVSKGFGPYNDAKENEWFYLTELSNLTEEDFVPYSANKVSVSDTTNMPNGAQVIIYTRIWNPTKKEYEFYAIDHNGDLVRAFEYGDTIQWVGLAANTMLWDFTEYYYEGTQDPNFYYEFQNAYSGKYLSPRLEADSILSDSPIGVNLNGRRYGDYHSSIIAWDDPYYDYAGIKANNYELTSCPLVQASEFYFAIMSPVVDELTTVDTIDNNDYGITMKMINYDGVKYDSGNRDRSQTDVLGSDTYNQSNGVPDLLYKTLGEDGYPIAKLTDRSLSELYDGAQDANHLFLANNYNISGYFEYSSMDNFATLGQDGNFTVYNQIGTIEGSNASLSHGQFMPYNTISTGVYSNRWTNTTDATDQPLSSDNPRKGEKLYAIPYNQNRPQGQENNADYHFGMEITASFTQTPSGLDAFGHDIIFKFTGDDDMWFYVDGVLVLDLGGIHRALSGTVNFKTGEITSSTGNSTLRKAFKDSYLEQHPGATDAECDAWLDTIFEEGTTVFKDYSTHDMKIFYMERGAGASNLQMKFNVAAVKPGTVQLTKAISGTEKSDYNLAEYPYQFYYKEEGDEEYHLLSRDNTHFRFTYHDSNVPVKYAASYTPVGCNTSYDSVFFLKPGQTADIAVPDDTVSYYIVECGVNNHIYDSVSANGDVLTGSPTADANHADYSISEDSVEDRPMVTYDNHVDENALRSLYLKKKLLNEDGSRYLNKNEDASVFDFRLYLGNENDTNPTLAYMQDYHVKDENNNYCRWDAATGKFASLGKSNYDSLTEAEKISATFVTSANGAVSKIPVNYTVEVRDLVIGTKFKVEERESEIPAGYRLKEYERVQGSYIVSEGDTLNSGTIRDQSDPMIEIHNQRGWGLTVKKTWSDASFMQSHDPTYFAIFLGGQPLAGTVKQMTNDTTSLYYYFQELENGYTFADYQIREVTISQEHPVIENGVVTNPGAITMIDDGDPVSIGGTSLDGVTGPSTYYASYQMGQATGSTENLHNVRVDKAVNTREGLKLKKTDWNGNPLANAAFTLKDSNGDPVGAASYVSDASGLITIAYLQDGTYTLEETLAPKHYQTPSDDLTITVNGSSITVSSDDSDAYTYTIADMPTITVKNREISFEAIKLDESGQPLSGARFALFKQISLSNGTMGKDYTPLTGYDNLISDEDGLIIEDISELPVGAYYLSETRPPSGYTKMAEDIMITIDEEGHVSTSSGSLWTLQTNRRTGRIDYSLQISNVKNLQKIKFKKVDTADPNNTALPGASFDLYRIVNNAREQNPLYANLVSDTDGFLVYQNRKELELADGTYHLIENTAPNGYIKRAAPVVITLSNGTVTYEEGSTLSQNGAGISTDPQSGTHTLLISNSSGYALPATGGIGTSPFMILGFLLIGIASVGLWIQRKVNKIR